MPKRRGVILGFGALAVGSGALVSRAAFSGNTVQPTANMQVLGDALRIQPFSDSDGDVFFVSAPVADPSSSFNRADLPRLEVSQSEANDSLELSLGAGTGVANTFGSAGSEPLEIVNDTSTSYDLKINYADDTNTSTNWGYGADVTDQTASTNNPASSGNLSYERVNSMFTFETTGNRDTTATQISPDGQDVTGTTVTLAPGDEAAVTVTVDTTSNIDGQSDTGAINAAIGTGSNPPFGTGNAWLDLLDTVWLEAT